MAKENIKKLEAGNIYFFYRPDVEQDQPDEISDVQRLYMVLALDGGDNFRLSIIGKKKLPDPSSKSNRVWGFIDVISSSERTIKHELGEKSYETKTRGTRHQPPARPVGEGRYQILVHDDHTHLIYDLELPGKPKETQESFEIEEQASYIISVKNPEKGAPKNAGLQANRQAEFPKTLQDVFRDRRFANADPPKFLDYEGCEFLLISASDDIKDELGITVDSEKETLEKSDIMNQLHLDKENRPVEPLVKGHWE